MRLGADGGTNGSSRITYRGADGNFGTDRRSGANRNSEADAYSNT